MTRYSSKIWLHIAAATTLAGTACWLAVDRGWEPTVALFTALCAFIASLKVLLEDQFAIGKAHRLSGISNGSEFQLNEKFVSTSLLLLSDSTKPPANDAERILVGAYGLLFRRLKLLKASQNGQLQPVSERADSFLRILAYTAKADFPVCGDWTAEGTQNDDARHLGDVLERMELFRIMASGGVQRTIPIRTVTSSLVLIKALRGSVPVFLMRWSDAWGGYYWFVGGIQEEHDKSAKECATRELREELGLSIASIQNVVDLANVKDRRISARQRVLTDYSYQLFSVALDESEITCAALLKPELSIPKTVRGGYQINQKCKWHTWGEIKASPNLVKDAGEILRTLEEFGLERIPYSFKSTVS